jgi:hypothetical protein
VSGGAINIDIQPGRLVSSATHVINVRVDSYCINEPLDGGIIPLPYTDADPDITVDPHDDVDTQRSARRGKGVKVGFQTSDEGRRHGEE